MEVVECRRTVVLLCVAGRLLRESAIVLLDGCVG